MNFNFPLLRPIRILLFPLSLLYALIVWLRNWCYDKGVFGSTGFNLPIICVGNLAVGGTGKSPMVEFLVRKLKSDHQVAILSRGYKRKTRGYAMAGEPTTALDIGDEPMEFHRKFPDIAVAVGEERIVAIPQLLHDRPGTEVIVLDDAFQHRAVKAGLNILLSDYSNLFTRDWWLPTGDLRDARKSYRRADLIVVTKCEETMNVAEKEAIIREIDPLGHQQVFFSSIRYGNPYHITKGDTCRITGDSEVLLVTGIANPGPLKRWLNDQAGAFFELSYNDHHIFTIDDLKTILRRFSAITAGNRIILTTEKDAVRLLKFDKELAEWPFYVIPIESGFLFDEERRFTEIISKFITGFKE
ncbi:MAG: tetraacyldisaccharide 4'-kinase [Puia sp.]|nr:tetraacyldisaccharide 4'-kinase [Puia sp.]